MSNIKASKVHELSICFMCGDKGCSLQMHRLSNVATTSEPTVKYYIRVFMSEGDNCTICTLLRYRGTTTKEIFSDQIFILVTSYEACQRIELPTPGNENRTISRNEAKQQTCA